MKQNMKIVFVTVFILFVATFSKRSLAQTVKDLYPNEEVEIIDYQMFPFGLVKNRDLLGLSREQQLNAKQMFARIHDAKLEAFKVQQQKGEILSLEQSLNFDRMIWAEFEAMLDTDQQQKFMQAVLVDFVRRRSGRVWNKHSAAAPLQRFIFDEAMARWLGVTSKQQSALNEAKRLAKIAYEKRPKTDSEKEKLELCERWQLRLYELLLPHQKLRYDDAIGDDADFMLKFERSLWSPPELFKSQPQNLHPNMSQTISADMEYKLGDLLYLTTPNLDAPIHPHPLFELLMEADVRADLKLKKFQHDQLARVRKDFLNKHPLPDKITIRHETGRNMTTQALRQAMTELEENFGFFLQQVERILTPQQNDRLRQLGNQFLISRSWKLVPLTCPEWIDYLELSKSQQAEFEKVHRHFRDLFQQAETTRSEFQQRVSRELEDEIARILTEEQKQMLLNFVSVAGY